MKELTFDEVQGCALEILKVLTDLCDKVGFKYVLAYGTLIGAIRHHGFIPWDDDIDIQMPRPDYDRLMEYLKIHPDALSPYKAMNADNTKGYPHNITRICDPRTWLDVTNERDCGMGVFVDIYVMDGIGCDYDEAMKIEWKAKKISSLLFLATRNYYHFGLTKGWKKRIQKLFAFVFTHIMGQEYFRKKSKELYQDLNYDNSDYVGCIRWVSYAPPRELFKKEELFGESVKCKFEKYEFNISAAYDTILRQIYGDYMQLPPEKDRIRHHLYKAYQK